jgi:hypothetical protein
MTDTAKSSLRNIGAAISSVHPLIYLVTYLLAIPVFASFYWIIPAGFFAPYARLEYAGQSDAYGAGLIIQQALRRAMARRSIRVANPDRNLQVREDMIDVQRLTSIDGQSIKFSLLLGLHDQDGLHQVEIPLLMRGDARVLVGSNTENRNFRTLEIGTQSNALLGERNLLNAAIEGLLTPSEPNDFLGPSIELSTDEDNKLQNFFNGLAGNPTAVSGAYGRMLYFSAIVITTVGFGDIVPFTSLARSIVALEAVLGVTLAGLFLNAVAYRAARGPR